MNRDFVNISAGLDLKRDSETLPDTSTSVSSILERFRCHQSIIEICYYLFCILQFSIPTYLY